MPTKRQAKRQAAASSSSSLSPPPSKAAKRKATPGPTDEFQQVTLPSFVDRYRVEGLGYGGDVNYQPGVGLCHIEGTTRLMNSSFRVIWRMSGTMSYLDLILVSCDFVMARTSGLKYTSLRV